MARWLAGRPIRPTLSCRCPLSFGTAIPILIIPILIECWPVNRAEICARRGWAWVRPVLSSPRRRVLTGSGFLCAAPMMATCCRCWMRTTCGPRDSRERDALKYRNYVHYFLWINVLYLRFEALLSRNLLRRTNRRRAPVSGCIAKLTSGAAGLLNRCCNILILCNFVY